MAPTNTATPSVPSPPDTGVMRMTVYFQPAEWAALHGRADEENMTMASLVRKAVQAYLHLS